MGFSGPWRRKKNKKRERKTEGTGGLPRSARPFSAEITLQFVFLFSAILFVPSSSCTVHATKRKKWYSNPLQMKLRAQGKGRLHRALWIVSIHMCTGIWEICRDLT